MVTTEEHQIGALAWRVGAILTESPQVYGVPVITGAIGVKDRFGDSAAPWELIKEFEVSAEHIAHRAVELMAVKKRPPVKREEPSFAGVLQISALCRAEKLVTFVTLSEPVRVSEPGGSHPIICSSRIRSVVLPGA